MPEAPLRPCAGGCGARVKSGACPSCARKTERRRGSARQRGYNGVWERFCVALVNQMLLAGIVPVCGATLPGGPTTQDSRCKVQGLLTFTSADGSSLHRDHEPPLLESERGDPAAVCNPLRIQLLCASCHAAKVERGPGGGVEKFCDRIAAGPLPSLRRATAKSKGHVVVL